LNVVFDTKYSVVFWAYSSKVRHALAVLGQWVFPSVGFTYSMRDVALVGRGKGKARKRSSRERRTHTGWVVQGIILATGRW